MPRHHLRGFNSTNGDLPPQMPPHHKLPRLALVSPLLPALAPSLKCTQPRDFSQTWLWLWLWRRKPGVRHSQRGLSKNQVVSSLAIDHPFLGLLQKSHGLSQSTQVCKFLYFLQIASCSCIQAFKNFNHNYFLFVVGEKKRGEEKNTMDV